MNYSPGQAKFFFSCWHFLSETHSTFLHLFGAKSYWRFEQIISENEATTKNKKMCRNFQNIVHFQIGKRGCHSNASHFPDLKTRPLLKRFAFSRFRYILMFRKFQIVPQFPDCFALLKRFLSFRKDFANSS